MNLDTQALNSLPESEQWNARAETARINGSKLGDRTKYIGGSDIAAIMGLSRWKTPLRVWAEKLAKIPPKDLSDLEHVEIGAELEEYVAYKFSKKTGYKVRRDSRTFSHPDHPFMAGHIDRWIVGEDALLECKTTSAWMAKEWKDEEIPQEYVLQVMWYLGLVGKKIGYIACLIGGQRFVWKAIEFKQELFDAMVQAALRFWKDFVETDIAPLAVADDDETLKALFPTSMEEEAVLDQEQATRFDMLVEERMGGLEALEATETDLAGIEAQIKQMLGEAESASTDAYVVTWKTQGREDPNRKKMKEDGVWEKYVERSSFRVLRTKKRKEPRT